MEIGRSGGGGGGGGGGGEGGGGCAGARGVMALGAANLARLKASPSSSSSSSSLKTNGEKGFCPDLFGRPSFFPFSSTSYLGFPSRRTWQPSRSFEVGIALFFSNFIERRETNVHYKGWRRLRRSGLLRLVPGWA